MPRPRALAAALLVMLAGCGGGKPSGSGSGSAVAEVADLDAASAPDAGWMPPADAGQSGEAAARADAGLVDVGFAACDALLARILSCPGIPHESKKAIAEAANEWRRSAGEGAQARESAASACLEAAAQAEEALLPMGC